VPPFSTALMQHGLAPAASGRAATRPQARARYRIGGDSIGGHARTPTRQLRPLPMTQPTLTECTLRVRI
jgi:hypothetical protein